MGSTRPGSGWRIRKRLPAKISKVIADFRPADPSASVPGLLDVRDELDRIKEDDWVPQKKAEVDQIIAACLGLHLEASTETAVVSPGQELPVKIEAINRSNVAVDWISYRAASAQATSVGESLPTDKLVDKRIQSAGFRRHKIFAAVLASSACDRGNVHRRRSEFNWKADKSAAFPCRNHHQSRWPRNHLHAGYQIQDRRTNRRRSPR